MPMHRFALAVASCVAALLTVACGGSESGQPAVAEPRFSVNRPRAPLGSPVELTYRFDVTPEGADLLRSADYTVFVHFLDSEGELMWTDDHRPEPPTTEWTAGQTVEYSRTMFVPIYPYIGEATVHLGLYLPSEGRRLPLKGRARGDREYEVGTLTLTPQSENIFLIYREGWHQPESPPEQPSVEWQWTKRVALLSFRNPRADLIFYLESDALPEAFAKPQQVAVKINDEVIHTFEAREATPTLRRIPIAASQLGDGDMVELRLEADQAFVPAQLPAGQPGHGRDDRELGIRVFHAVVAPK
jgi:hypothetical protein